MSGIQLSADFGIVIRKAALNDPGITETDLFELMEAERPFDANEELISFGPHFGEEAAQEFIRRLEAAGLTYGDDFFEFSALLPSWCRVQVMLAA